MALGLSFIEHPVGRALVSLGRISAIRAASQEALLGSGIAACRKTIEFVIYTFRIRCVQGDDGIIVIFACFRDGTTARYQAQEAQGIPQTFQVAVLNPRLLGGGYQTFYPCTSQCCDRFVLRDEWLLVFSPWSFHQLDPSLYTPMNGLLLWKEPKTRKSKKKPLISSDLNQSVPDRIIFEPDSLNSFTAAFFLHRVGFLIECVYKIKQFSSILHAGSS